MTPWDNLDDITPWNNTEDMHADGSSTMPYPLERSPIISAASMYYINIYLNIVVRGSIWIFGILNNLVNMTIFHHLGLKDSMSVCLMALSFTDFIVNVLGAGMSACIVWQVFFPGTPIDPVSFRITVFWWTTDIAYQCSGWITTFLSVERCVCVVFPFKVKQIFTKLRTLYTVIMIYVVILAIHMPIFVSMKLAWTKIEYHAENDTVFIDRMIVDYSDNWDEIMDYVNIADIIVLPYPSQAIVLISVIWMTVGLWLSSQVRTSKTTSETESGKKSGLSAKERRLVKVVIFLAIIFLICNLLRFLAVYVEQIFSKEDLQAEGENLRTFMLHFSLLANAINCSINIFVYLTINRNYRMKFRKIFLRN